MRFLYLLLAGVAGGVLAGMGMGGGTLTLPLLVLCLNVGQLTAQFANLVAFLPSGAVSLALHIKNGLVKKTTCFSFLSPLLQRAWLARFLRLKQAASFSKNCLAAFLSRCRYAPFFQKR